MKRNIGWTIVAIALVHTLTAAWLFSAPLLDMARAGLVNSVHAPPMTAIEPIAADATLRLTRRAFVYWFVSAGFVFLLLGMAIRELESHKVRLPVSLGYWLLAMALAGGVIWPVSGAWLLLIPAVGVLRASSKGGRSA